MALATILLTAVLDVISLRTVRDLLTKQTNGRRIYFEGVAYNLVNHFLLGLPMYVITALVLCDNRRSGYETAFSWTSAARILIIIMLHSFGYYHIHRKFHTSPHFFKYHAFHHRYKEFIPPSASNAVSQVEYLVAYLLPFSTGAALTRPTTLELQTAVNIVSILSLLDHMPVMEKLGDYVEPFFVTARSHSLHHKQVTRNYAAPTWNLDWISSQIKTWRCRKERSGNFDGVRMGRREADVGDSR